MSAINRRRDPGGLSGEMILVWVGLGLCVVIIGGVYVSITVAQRLADSAAVPSNPFDLFFNLVAGDVNWSAGATAVAVALSVVVIMIMLVVWTHAKRRRQTRIDAAASHLGRGREIEAVSAKTVRRAADRFGVVDAVGVPIGRTVIGNRPLFGSWEDMHVDIWGPRTGKSTSRAIPAILEAPGAVLVTSNKRDVVDATRDVRGRDDSLVWVFDPQGIANEEPDWWWDPLSYVTDEVRAARLADHFAAGSREPGARTDAYFDPAGRDLLAGLLLAAALAGEPITAVYTWLTQPTEDAPVEILRGNDFPLTADQVEGVINAPEKQRGGIYGTAQQMASCLTNRTVTRWVTPRADRIVDPRPHFVPAEFVRSAATLYSLSKEGSGNAGPLVTALTVAVIEAAEEYAVESSGGRLSTPLLGVLDEAANVCRWRDLPNLYSHYGSRGIVLMTILQSWSQGVEVWGESGMKKLWSAANIKTYGGGVSEAQFLEDLSRLVGDYDRLASSTSTGKGHRNVSQHLQRERILDVADLAAMPKGRALVFASGSRPTLIRIEPWMTGRHAAAVRASIAAHDPQAKQTIAAAEGELVAATSADKGGR